MPATVNQDVADAAAGQLLTGTGAGHLRRERFADEAASQLIAGMHLVLEKARQAYQMTSDAVSVSNVLALDNTGDLPNSVLAERAAQNQPNQRTFEDPNYRAGASAPPGTKAQ